MNTSKPDEFLTEKLSKWVIQTHYDDFSPDVIREVKKTLFDNFGAYFSSLRAGLITSSLNNFISDQGDVGEFHTWGLGTKLSLLSALFYTSAIMHSIELDDGYRFGTVHPGTVIIPAALIAVVGKKTSGKQFIEAIVNGYEVMCRLAEAINPSHWKRGFHTTSTCGSIGACVAVGKIFQLDQQRMTNALALSGLSGFGLQEMLYSGQMSKSIQVGRSAQGGLLSVQLALNGVEGPQSLFEGELGWFKAVCDQVNWEAINRPWGKDWLITKRYMKQYPTCRHLHTTLDIILSDEFQNQFVRESINNIVKITVYTYHIAVVETGKIKSPKNFQEAIFSIPFVAAVALVKKDASPESIIQALQEKDIYELAGRIDVEENPELEKLYPHNRAAMVEIIFQGNRKIEMKALIPQGDPENPIPEEKVIIKFKNNAHQYLSEQTCQKINDFIETLENQSDVNQLNNLLAKK